MQRIKRYEDKKIKEEETWPGPASGCAPCGPSGCAPPGPTRPSAPGPASGWSPSGASFRPRPAAGPTPGSPRLGRLPAPRGPSGFHSSCEALACLFAPGPAGACGRLEQRSLHRPGRELRGRLAQVRPSSMQHPAAHVRACWPNSHFLY
jgi:hypothetical protein